MAYKARGMAHLGSHLQTKQKHIYLGAIVSVQETKLKDMGKRIEAWHAGVAMPSVFELCIVYSCSKLKEMGKWVEEWHPIW